MVQQKIMHKLNSFDIGVPDGFALSGLCGAGLGGPSRGHIAKSRGGNGNIGLPSIAKARLDGKPIAPAVLKSRKWSGKTRALLIMHGEEIIG